MRMAMRTAIAMLVLLRPAGLAAQAVGTTPGPGAARDAAPDGPRASALQWLPHALGLSWRSGVPDARGDGAAMTGTGVDAFVTAGVRWTRGPWVIQLAPELHVNENRVHPTFPSGDAGRDPFASPFYHGAYSADLPSRPGASSFVAVAPGESMIRFATDRFTASATTALAAWGPDQGEGLVLGRSAPGFPRLELAWGTTRWRARWFGGAVRESAWFDDDDTNDWRALSGLRLELERVNGMSAGLSRTVMNAGGRSIAEGAALPFGRARPGTSMELVAADLTYRHVPAGTAVWLELARQAPIRSAGALLRAPTEGLAYRLGVRQRIARRADVEWQAEFEHMRLEQGATRDDVAPQDLYTSGVVVQGWTHLGQSLGSGVGPGGQRQLAVLQREDRTWRLGVFAERVRWNEDAMLREPAAATDRHDVTLQLGALAEREVAGYIVAGRLAMGRRLNHLFQGASVRPDAQPVDLRLFSVGVTLRAAR